MLKGISFIPMACILCMWSCNKTSDFGADLGLDENIEVEFTTDIPISYKTEVGDSVLVYSQTTLLTSYLCGKLNDPEYGVAESELFFQVNLSATPDFSDATFDSVVLSIAYDTTLKGYGDILQEQSYRVYRLEEDLVVDQNYFSSNQIATGDLLGVKLNDRPRFGELTPVIEPTPSGIDTFGFPPVLRVRLDEAFGQSIVEADTNTFTSLDNFHLIYKGFALQALNETSVIYNFDLSSFASRLNVYYTQGDTLPLLHTFPVLSNSVRFSRFMHDYTSTDIEDVISNGIDADSTLYIQSMQGLRTMLEFGDLSELGDVSINNAIFEITAIDQSEELDSLYPIIDQIIMVSIAEDGTRSFVADLESFLGSTAVGDFFGGTPILDSEGNTVYRMNISQHLQDMLTGAAPKTVAILSANRTSSASRTTFYGPSSPFPPNMRVTYTLKKN